MGLILGYDTETTGIPDFKARSEAPHQPHMVQLAAVLVDEDTRKIEQSMDVIIHPLDWVITEEMTAIHGISHQKAFDTGVWENTALQLFLQMWAAASMRVAHNEQFDARIIRIAMARYGTPANDIELFKGGVAGCTQRLSTPILRLPPTPKMVAARMPGPKSANLSEAYLHFTGKPLENAHSAMADTLACMAVWWAIRDRQAAAA